MREFKIKSVNKSNIKKAMNAPLANDTNKESLADHDPQYIKFTYWSTLLTFNDNHPTPISEKQKTVFLKNSHQNSTVREEMVNTYISIRNNSNFPVLSFNIYSNRAGKTIFKLPELPNKKSIKIEFKKEGLYDLYYFIAGSTSFSRITFNVSTKIKTVPGKNFDWDLKSSW